MDGISLGVGIIGLVMQCFGAVHISISLLQDVQDLDSKSALLRCKLQIEQHLLHAWGQDHGLTDGTLAARVPDDMRRRLILSVLRGMLSLVAETDKLRSKYGLDHVSQLPGIVNPGEQSTLGVQIHMQGSSSVPITSFTALHISSDPQGVAGSSVDIDGIELTSRNVLAKWKTSFPWKKRCTWLIKDARKFQELVENLRYFNESLDRLTNSRARTLLGAGSTLVSSGSGSDNTQRLQMIEAASATAYPEISTAAAISRRTAEAEATETATTPSSSSQTILTSSTLSLHREMRIDPSLLRLAHKSASKTLTMGTLASPYLGETPVLIQWRRFEHPVNLETTPKTTRRIQSTALILSQQRNQPATLGLLTCLGYALSPDNTRLGYAFSLPRSPPAPSPDRTPRTLFQLLDSSSPASRYAIPPPPLEVRLALATRLCTTVYWLHVSGLVHKSIRSDNVLLFRHAGERAERLESPYIVGFDYTRREDDETITRTASTHEQDLYRHPEFLFSISKRSTKLHDLYSLGLVLLEIGCWFSLGQLAPDGDGGGQGAPVSGSDLRTHLLAEGGPVSQLAYRVGTKYMDIVRTCIRGSFEVGDDDISGNAVQSAFQHEVVDELLQFRI